MGKIHPFDGVANDVILENGTRACRVNVCYLVGAFIVVVCGLTVYIGLASSTMQTAYPSLQTTEIHTMSANRTKTHSLETQLTLRVSFDVPSEIKAIPQLGTFVLSKTVNKSLTLRATVDTKYNVSGQDQLLLLKFQIPGFFSVNESDLGRSWMKLEGDFGMLAKLIHYPLFPKSERHATLVCHVIFKNDQLDQLDHRNCVVRSL